MVLLFMPDKLARLIAGDYSRHLRSHKIRPPAGFPESVWTLTLTYLVEITHGGLVVNELKHGRRRSGQSIHAWHCGEDLGLIVDLTDAATVCVPDPPLQNNGPVAVGVTARTPAPSRQHSGPIAIGYQAAQRKVRTVSRKPTWRQPHR